MPRKSFKTVAADVRGLKSVRKRTPEKKSGPPNVACYNAREQSAARLLVIRNLQRERALNTRWLKAAAQLLLHALLGQNHYALCFHFISARRMAELNWTFLQHEGPTDVITFNQSHERSDANEALCGEIFICPAVAVAQAKDFKTSWQAEVTRYVIHGVLHLLGYDDGRAAERRIMKQEENRLLRLLTQQCALQELGGPSRRGQGTMA